MSGNENNEALEAAKEVASAAIEQAGKVGVEEAKRDRKIGEKRYDNTSAVAGFVTKDKKMTSKDKRDVIDNNSDNNREIEKVHARRDVEIARERWKTARLAIVAAGVVAIASVISNSIFKIVKACKGLKLMAMDDLVHKARPNAKLEHHYIEVLRALGEMKLLKKEGSEEYDEELYKLLTQLKGILEALIFKGSYGITVESGAKKLRKLVTDIAGDGNFTNDWMKYLDEDERRTLKEQANEIMESIPSAKTKKRNVER